MSSGSFYVIDPDGYKPLGYVADGGISITGDDATAVLSRESLDVFRGEMQTVSFTVDRIDAKALDSFFHLPEIKSTQPVVLEYRPQTRRELLRERAEMVGGKFLRNYLKSQRRSRRNQRTPNDGGVVRRGRARKRVMLYDARIEPILGAGTNVQLSIEGRL